MIFLGKFQNQDSAISGKGKCSNLGGKWLDSIALFFHSPFQNFLMGMFCHFHFLNFQFLPKPIFKSFIITFDVKSQQSLNPNRDITQSGPHYSCGWNHLILKLMFVFLFLNFFFCFFFFFSNFFAGSWSKIMNHWNCWPYA